MCTVTFIPQGSNLYITSNRDESPDRQATGLKSTHTPDWNAIHFPLDELSGGSWIALADRGRVVCLLNGGFEPFIPNPPYRMSRGQVVVDAAAAEDTNQFLLKTEFNGIAPFTLLIYENHILLQLIWDGDQKSIAYLPFDEPRIWSSVTLYPPKVREWRKSLFEKWLSENPVVDRESIIAFHQMANGDPDNGFVMNRKDLVKTLSVTSIELKETSASILHLALDQDKREEVMVHYDG
ncbi:MAG: NRDE family protein [Saprospiraceae bacterium]|nr:NRDE family protein [Candidatus Opimibacter skivensis]